MLGHAQPQISISLPYKFLKSIEKYDVVDTPMMTKYGVFEVTTHVVDKDKMIKKYIPDWALPLTSILVCAMSSVVMTAASVAVKKIDMYYDGGILFVVMARFIIMFILSTPILCYK